MQQDLKSLYEQFQFPNCAGHQKSQLSLICCEKMCPKNGQALCVMCQKQHVHNHTDKIYPIEQYFDDLLRFIRDSPEDLHVKGHRIYLSQLQKQIFALQQSLSSISEQLKQHEAEIQGALDNQLMKQVEETVRAIFANQAFINNLDQLKTLIVYQENQIQFAEKAKPNKFMNKEYQEQINCQLKKLEQDITALSINLSKKEDIIAPDSGFKFIISEEIKTITLKNNGFTAVQTKNSSGKENRIVLVSPPINQSLGQNIIVFKIDNVANWVGVGMCKKSTIIQNQYNWAYDGVFQHGTYLLSSNGYNWKHGQIFTQNFQGFLSNDVIAVINENKLKNLKFKIIRNSLVIETIVFDLSEETLENEELHFLANIIYVGDQVSIINDDNYIQLATK